MWRPSSPDGCSAQFSFLVSVQFVLAAVLLVFRPYRTLSSNVLSAGASFSLGLTLLGSAIASRPGQHPGNSGEQLNLVGVQLVMAFTLLRIIDTTTRIALEHFWLKQCPAGDISHEWRAPSGAPDAATDPLDGVQALLLVDHDGDESKALEMRRMRTQLLGQNAADDVLGGGESVVPASQEHGVDAVDVIEPDGADDEIPIDELDALLAAPVGPTTAEERRRMERIKKGGATQLNTDIEDALLGEATQGPTVPLAPPVPAVLPPPGAPEVVPAAAAAAPEAARAAPATKPLDFSLL